MNNPDLLKLLNTFPRLCLVEAYTDILLSCFDTPWLDCDVVRIVEVRLRANQMPEVIYETDRSLQCILPRPKINGENDARQPR